MNWAVAFFAATIWLLAASLWQIYRPMPETAAHRHVALRVFQDLTPAILLAFLLARFM